jgi:hypothetical protein
MIIDSSILVLIVGTACGIFGLHWYEQYQRKARWECFVGAVGTIWDTNVAFTSWAKDFSRAARNFTLLAYTPGIVRTVDQTTGTMQQFAQTFSSSEAHVNRIAQAVTNAGEAHAETMEMYRPLMRMLGSFGEDESVRAAFHTLKGMIGEEIANMKTPQETAHNAFAAKAVFGEEVKPTTTVKPVAKPTTTAKPTITAKPTTTAKPNTVDAPKETD